MERKNTPWPDIPQFDSRSQYRQTKKPAHMSTGANNSNRQWRHYPASANKDGRRQRKQYQSNVDYRPDTKAKRAGSFRFELPLVLLVALTLIFSAFAFYRSNQVYVALDQISSNLLSAIEENSQTNNGIVVKTNPVPSQPDQPVDITISSEDPSIGNANATVTLVEFSDFQCPFCKAFVPTTQQILSDYGDQVRLVYRDFPLAIHPQAQPAAIAAQCVMNLAGDEAFFKYHDQLFERQSELGDALYSELAANLDIDQNDFTDCSADSSVKDEVNQDYQDGLTAGVQGTPTTFVNGTAVSGAVPYTQIKSIIDQALDQ